jgi:hypothetical protein
MPVVVKNVFLLAVFGSHLPSRLLVEDPAAHKWIDSGLSLEKLNFQAI